MGTFRHPTPGEKMLMLALMSIQGMRGWDMEKLIKKTALINEWLRELQKQAEEKHADTLAILEAEKILRDLQKPPNE